MVTTTLERACGEWRCRVMYRVGSVVVTVRDESAETRADATSAAGVEDGADWHEVVRREALSLLLDAVAEVAR